MNEEVQYFAVMVLALIMILTIAAIHGAIWIMITTMQLYGTSILVFGSLTVLSAVLLALNSTRYSILHIIFIVVMCISLILFLGSLLLASLEVTVWI
jgi:hypothetical protein